MNQRGIFLLESVLAVIVISGIVFLLANIPNSIALINKSKHLSIAKEIAAKAIEDKRSLDYSNLAQGTNIPVTDSRIDLLPSGTASITVALCGQVLCPNSESAKVVSVIVDWKESDKEQQFKMDTIISEGGF